MQFKQLAAPTLLGCGILTDGRIGCFGDTRFAVVPPGQFIDLGVDLHGSANTLPGDEIENICGLRADGSVICPADPVLPELDAPPGSFKALAGGTGVAGLAPDGSVIAEHFDQQNPGPPTFAPDPALPGSFTQLSDPGGRCGVRSDGAAVCSPIFGNPTIVIPGPFVEVTADEAEGGAACALTPAGTLSCFWADPQDPQNGQNDELLAWQKVPTH
jgi:hypothetical protein